MIAGITNVLQGSEQINKVMAGDSLVWQRFQGELYLEGTLSGSAFRQDFTTTSEMIDWIAVNRSNLTGHLKAVRQGIVEPGLSMYGFFRNCVNITSLDLSEFDTSQVVSMEDMFYNCTSLVEINLQNFDTSQVVTMSDMFYQCSKLVDLDLSSFRTSSVTTLSSMFHYCTSLVTLNLKSFDTTNVTSMQSMFNTCTSLTILDLSSFDTTNITGFYKAFDRCTSVTKSYARTEEDAAKLNAVSGKPANVQFIVKKYEDWVYEMGTPIYGIKTSGASYINTGFLPTPDLETKESYTFLDYTGGSVAVSGSRTSYQATDTYALWVFTTTSTFRLDNGTTTHVFSNNVVENNIKYNIFRTPSAITINEVVQTIKPTSINTGSALPMYIGTINQSGTPVGYPAPLIIHEWEGKNIDKEVKFIPFIHKDGTVGMLDLVTGIFEGSATDTPFEAVTESSTALMLNEIGVEPTNDANTNMQMLQSNGITI